MKLNDNEMKTYLKHVVDLESSVYAQQKAYERAKKELKLEIPSLEHIDQPEKKRIIKPSKPERDELSEKEKSTRTFCIITLFFIIVLEIVSCAKMSRDALPLAIIEIILATTVEVLLLYHIIKYSKKQKEFDERYEQRVESYKKEMSEYNKTMKIEQKNYDEALRLYKDRVEQAKLQHNENAAIAESNYNKALQLIKSLERPLDEARSILEKMYACDYIFPKYRNLIAVCTFYEYFMTGRVSALEGPDGAYNLYEAELRQNLIINRLDNIIDQLEQVKENQFTLYQEVKKTNETLNGISKDIRNILVTNKKIENNTELISKATSITAFYSQVIAENSEAIKYLSLINS